MLRATKYLAPLALLVLSGCHWDWDQTCQTATCRPSASSSASSTGSSGTTGSTSSSSGSTGATGSGASSSSSGGTGSTGSSGSTGSTGTSGCPGASPFEPVADSATPLCADAANIIDCAAARDAGADGQDGQVVNASAYTHPTADTTFDPVTGLTWQAATDLAADDAGFTWSEASTLCDQLDAGGYDDWRLPSLEELLSMDDMGRYPKTFDPAFFDFPNGDYMTWSASPAPAAGKAVRLTFYNGEAVTEAETVRHPVRCVRGGLCSTTPRFVTANGVTFDRLTNLSWQQAWPSPRDWVSALAYCDALTLNGASWHLATVHELASLLDYGLAPPLLDTSSFTPQSSSSSFGPDGAWSSSPVGQTSSGPESWFVNFDDGSVYRDARSDSLNVACVHAGP